MVSFTTNYIEPGVYVQIKDVLSPTNVSGLLIAAFIGIGSATKTLTKVITRGNTPNGKDLVDINLTDIISVVDAFGITYFRNSDWLVDLLNTVQDVLNVSLTTTTLTSPMTSGDTTALVVDTSSFSSSGLIFIDNELISYSGKTPTSFTGLTRGVGGYTAASHLSGATVTQVTLITTTLSAGLTSTDTACSVASTTGFAGFGYIKIDSEVMSYSGTTPTSFTGLVRGVAGTVAASHLSSATVTDVNVLSATGNIDWSPNFVGPNDFPKSKEPAAGVKFSVTYTATKTSSDYNPITFINQQDVIDFYGAPDPTNSGVISNTITLGIQLYFANGGPQQVVGVQMDPTGRNFSISSDRVAAIIEALGKLVNTEVYVVVPMETATSSTNTALLSAMKNHVENESSLTERKERVGLLGAPAGTDLNPNPETIYIASANALNSSRMAYLAPSEGLVLLTNGEEIIVDGASLSASVAGIICNPNVTAGEPISGKGLAGFSDVHDPFTRQQKNLMAGNGVLIIEDQDGAFNIRHALSTDVSSIIRSEFKIQRIKDVISKTTRTSLQKAFINTRDLGPDTLTAIKSFVNLLLGQFVTTHDIISVIDLTVTKDPSDPRQVNISVSIQPAFDINYILVTFNTKL